MIVYVKNVEKKKFTTTDEGLPRKGKFGPNITSLWEMLHYQGVIPFDRLATISENCFDTKISPGGLHNVIYRTAENSFHPNFNRIKRRVIKSKNMSRVMKQVILLMEKNIGYGIFQQIKMF